MKKSLDAIDIAKFAGSILIFAMHCNVLRAYASVRIVPQLLARWCVPFFFLCSAYFLFRKGRDGNVGKETLRAYIRRIGSLYAVWLVFNLPNVVVRQFYAKDLSAAGTWLVFLKNALLSSTFTGSWYLASSIFSAWLVHRLSARFRTGTVMGITFLFYLLCVFTSAYRGVLPSGMAKILLFLCFPLNLFNGCFYFSLGKYFAEHRQSVLAGCGQKRALLLFAGFCLLFLAEILLTKRLGINGSTDVAFSTAPMAAALFLFCLKVRVKIGCGLLLRRLSTILYCCQGNVLLVNALLNKLLQGRSILSFLISALAAAAICAAVLYIQNNTGWKWTRYLT